MKKVIVKIAAILLGTVAALQASHATTTSYEYDALGRLTTVYEGTKVVRYLYDAAGNRTRKQIESGTPTVITMGSTTAQVHKKSVVFTVNVGGSATSGTVDFYDGATYIGSSMLMNGVATVEIIGMPVGAHTITVSYSGDGSASLASSIAFPVKVVSIDWLPAVLEILLN